MHASKSPLLAVAAAIVALGILSAPVLAAETAADVPKDSYYNDPLTRDRAQRHRPGGERLAERRPRVGAECEGRGRDPRCR